MKNILKEFPGVKALDDEAIRLVLLLDGWEPGKINGKSCSVTYAMPLNFEMPTAAEWRKQRRAERRKSK